MIHKDLLIVGAGPAGLALSSALAPQLSPTVISETRASAPSHSRATGIQPRVLEILRSIGVFDAVTREALSLRGNVVYLDGERKLAVSFFDPVTKQHGLSLDQRRIEHFIEEKLKEKGRSIEWDTSLVGLEIVGDRVLSEVQRRDGSTELWSCDFVVGCDGGRSAVRKAAGIPFPGTTYDERNFVADAVINGDLDGGYMHYFVSRHSRLVLVPLNGNGLWKMSGAFPLGGEGSLNDLLHSLVLEHSRGRFTVEPIGPISTYVMHARLADTFVREGRIFLCGDAAHLFPPNGGQGMNVALEDAYELALAFNSLSETADSTALSRYAHRRNAVHAKLEACRSAKSLYDYDNLRQGSFDQSGEQRRIEREELQ